jgi:hypothetical protein
MESVIDDKKLLVIAARKKPPAKFYGALGLVSSQR